MKMKAKVSSGAGLAIQQAIEEGRALVGTFGGATLVLAPAADDPTSFLGVTWRLSVWKGDRHSRADIFDLELFGDPKTLLGCVTVPDEFLAVCYKSRGGDGGGKALLQWMLEQASAFIH